MLPNTRSADALALRLRCQIQVIGVNTLETGDALAHVDVVRVRREPHAEILSFGSHDLDKAILLSDAWRRAKQERVADGEYCGGRADSNRDRENRNDGESRPFLDGSCAVAHILRKHFQKRKAALIPVCLFNLFGTTERNSCAGPRVVGRQPLPHALVGDQREMCFDLLVRSCSRCLTVQSARKREHSTRRAGMLFRSQRYDRIYFRRSARGYATRHESHRRQHQNCEHDRHRIVWRHSVELAPDESAGEKRHRRADERSQPAPGITT